MTEKEKMETCPPVKCKLILLVLFVGLVFGFIAGYASKDAIVQSLSKIVKTDMDAIKNESRVSPASTGTEPSSGEIDPETIPSSEDENKDEQKKQEDEKATEEK